MKQEINVLQHNLRRLRHERGLTQRQVEKAAGVANIRPIESGRRRFAKLATLQALARVFGVPVDVLLRDVGPYEGPSRIDNKTSGSKGGER